MSAALADLQAEYRQLRAEEIAVALLHLGVTV